MKAKDLIIIVLAFWIFTLYKKQKQATTTARGAEAQPSGGGGASLAPQAPAIQPQAPAASSFEKAAPSPALLVYGSYSDSANAQRLTLDLPAAEALKFSIGQGVKVLNSNMYPLYYKVAEIYPKDEKTAAVVIDTLFVGAEVDIYLSSDKYNVSGFTARLTKKTGSFL